VPRRRQSFPCGAARGLRLLLMASGTGSSPPPETGAPVAAVAASEEELEQAVEGEDAFEIPSKNASHDRLRQWRVRLLVSTNTA